MPSDCGSSSSGVWLPSRCPFGAALEAQDELFLAAAPQRTPEKPFGFFYHCSAIGDMQPACLS